MVSQNKANVNLITIRYATYSQRELKKNQQYYSPGGVHRGTFSQTLT
jgi:hypothetical protein